MAITITDSIGVSNDTTPQEAFKPSLVAEDDSFEADLLRPSLEAEKQAEEDLNQWRSNTLQKIDDAVLNLDGFMAGKSEAVRKRAVIRKTLEAELDWNPSTTAQYRIDRRQAARKIFGEDIGDSDESFINALRSRATERKEEREFVGRLKDEAAMSSLTGWSQLDASWGDAAKNDPVFSNNPGEAVRRFAEFKKDFEDEYSDVLPVVRQLNELIEKDETGEAVRLIENMDSDDFSKAAKLLAFIERNQSESGSDRGVGGNIAESAQRDSQSLVRKFGQGFLDILSGISAGSTGADFVAEDMEHRDKVNGFLAEVRRFRDQRDPIQLLSEEGSVLSIGEKALYGVPGIGVTIAGSAMPGGAVATMGLLVESAQEDYYLRAIDAGVEREEANQLAGSVAVPIAALQFLPERIGIGAVTRKMPMLSSVLDKLNSKLARQTIGSLTRAGAETVTEEIQAILGEVGNDALNALKEDIPEADWDAHWANFGTRNLETFLSIAPYSSLGAMRHDRGVSRSMDLADQASEEELVAAGHDREAVQKYQQAETEGEKRDAFFEMTDSQDPESEETKEAAENLSKLQAKARETQEEKRRLRISPAVRTAPDKEGFQVYDVKTGDTIAAVDTAQEATETVFSIFGVKESQRQAEFDELLSKFEAGRLDADESGQSVEIETRTFTEADALQELPGSDARIQTERMLIEQRDGGTGEVTEEVMGEGSSIAGVFVPAGQMGRKEAVTRLFNGSSVLTMIHERGHAKRRSLMQSGKWSRAQQVGSIKALDSMIESESDRFLPASFDTMSEADQEVALDEAVAELAEVLALRTRKGGKSKMRGLINKNLAAMVRSRVKGAAQLSAFLKGIREFFGLALRRAAVLKKASRDGKISGAQLDALTDMLVGTTPQEQFEAERDSVPTQMIDGVEVDTPFSIDRSEVTPARDAIPPSPEGARQSVTKSLFRDAPVHPELLPPEKGEGVADHYWINAILDDDGKLTVANSEHGDIMDQVEEYTTVDNVNARGWVFIGNKNAHGIWFEEYDENATPEQLQSVKDRFLSVQDLDQAKGSFYQAAVNKAKEEGRPFYNESRDEISYQIGDARMLSSLAESAKERVRDPEARATIFSEIARRIDDLKRDVDQMIRVAGRDLTRKAIVDRRTVASLKKEGAMRQALRREELENEILQQEGAVLAAGDAMTLKEMPLHGYIANVGSKLNGGMLESPSAFAKRTGREPGAEYEGSEGVLGAMLYGGLRSPDQMAQELHAEGLLAEDSPSLMWSVLETERTSIKNQKAEFKKALARLGEAKKQAKEEIDQWMEDQMADQERDYNKVARIRRSLVLYDAILKALPPELRGKVGGFVQLSKLNSDAKRLEFLETRLEKVDAVVERWIQEEHRKQIDKLFKKGLPEKTSKGVPKSKLAAPYTDRVLAIQKMSKLSKDEVDSLLEGIQDLMEETSNQAEIDALTSEMVELISFGNMKGMNAQALDSFFRNLKSVVETGKMLKDFADEQFRVKADGIKQIVNHDVTGGGGTMTSSQAKRRAKENERFKNLTKFHRQNISFEWLMNNLARENKRVGTLESDTHKNLSTMVHEATHKEKRANMELQTRYQEALSHIFGGLKGLKLTNEISKLMEEVENTGVIRIDYGGNGAFSKKTARAANIQSVIDGETDLKSLGFTTQEWESAKARYEEIAGEMKDGKVNGSRVIEYESPNVGTPDNLTLSQSQAINLTMLFRQEGLKESMIHEGYTEETMKQMESFLSPESKAIRHWLTSEYSENYHVINDVFKEANGVSLPQTEFYSPARRLADGKVDDLSIDSRGGSAMSTNPNFTISRTKNFAEVDQTADALSIYMQHMIQTNHYVSWAEPTKLLRTVFSDKGVKKNIKDYAGDSLLQIISERIEWMADGGNRKATHLRWLDNLRAAHTYSSLAFNWGVAIKQLTSLPAYAFDMSFKDFGKYALRFMADPVKNLKEMGATDYVKTRFKEGYERDVIDGLRKEGGIFMKGLQAGMLFGKAGDIVPVMIGGWMARQRSYDNAIADGLSESEARRKADIDFEMATDRAQQAGDLKDLSTFQGGGSIFKLFTMYKTSPRQYYSNVYESFLDAKSGKKGASKELARRLFIGQIILPLTFQFASDLLRSPFDDDDEALEAENYIRAMLLGPLNGLFIAGDFAELITSGIADAKIWEEKLPIADGMTKVAYGFASFWDGDWAEGLDEVARGVGKTVPSGITFYDIIRKELKRFGVGE